MDPVENPFAPGAGTPPPELAGRDELLETTPQAYDPGFAFGDTFRIGSPDFQGRIDEVGVFDLALAASEIQAIYGAGSAGKCKPSCLPPPRGLVSWWPGDGNPHDVVGGHHASLSVMCVYQAKGRFAWYVTRTTYTQSRRNGWK